MNKQEMRKVALGAARSELRRISLNLLSLPLDATYHNRDSRRIEMKEHGQRIEMEEIEKRAECATL